MYRDKAAVDQERPNRQSSPQGRCVAVTVVTAQTQPHLPPGMQWEWIYASKSRIRNKRRPRIRTDDISPARTIRSIVASEIRK
jgi:hypothetical protein